MVNELSMNWCTTGQSPDVQDAHAQYAWHYALGQVILEVDWDHLVDRREGCYRAARGGYLAVNRPCEGYLGAFSCVLISVDFHDISYPHSSKFTMVELATAMEMPYYYV